MQSRDSQLAMIQSNFVKDSIQKVHPQIQVDIHSGKTMGDRVLNVPLAKIGDKGLFTKELEEALLGKMADIAVHSLKDVPTKMTQGLVLGAILERHNPRDALVMRSDMRHLRLHSLPAGSVVGTSSVRRKAQLSHYFPHLQFQDVRGNLNTRLRKLEDSQNGYVALVLAVSGLERMNMHHHITEVLETTPERWFGYAVGQGALAVQNRDADADTIAYIQHLNHADTQRRCDAERALMKELEGGCHAPIAVETSVSGPSAAATDEATLTLTAAVYSLDGVQCVKDCISGPISTCESMGKELALILKQKGASEILHDTAVANAEAVKDHQKTVEAALKA